LPKIKHFGLPQIFRLVTPLLRLEVIFEIGLLVHLS